MRRHRLPSSKDRDRLREEVLNGLGWELVRVWSTDWFDNPSKEADRLVAKLEQLRKRPVPAFTSYPPLHQGNAVVDSEVVEEVAKTPSEEVPPVGEPTLDVLKTAPAPSKAEPAFDGMALLEGTGKLTPAQAALRSKHSGTRSSHQRL
jgi:hypothetical protein